MYKPILAPSEEDFLRRCRVGFGLSSDDNDPEPYIDFANGGSGGSVSDRPKPNRLRRGLIGGTGGAASMPFRRDAPAGKSIVSTTEVVEISTGSPISDFLIDILRERAAFAPALASRFGALTVAGNAGATGVDDDERGGVG